MPSYWLVSLPLLSHAPESAEKHLVVGSNRIFSRVVDAEAAAILEERFTDVGLKLHKRDKIHYTIRPGGEVVLSRVEAIEDNDPVLNSFLSFLARDIASHPERLQAISQPARAGATAMRRAAPTPYARWPRKAGGR